MRTLPTTRRRALLLAGALLGPLALSLPLRAAEVASALAGCWATQGFGSVVEFRPCATAPTTMCGRIRWLWQERDVQGAPRRDEHNPERALRTRSLVGIEIVRGLRETEPGVWSDGELNNPDDGRTYTGSLRVRGGVLELRGCALRVFCQIQTWCRPEALIAELRGLDR